MSYFTALVAVVLLSGLLTEDYVNCVRFPRSNRTLNNNFITKRNVYNSVNGANNLNNVIRNGFQNQFSTTTTTSTATNQKSREQYLVQVFEVLIMTLDQKLQQIDRLDQTIERLSQKVDHLNGRVAYNAERTESILKSCDSNKLTKSYFDNKIATIDTKLNQIDNKLNQIQVNGNSIPDSSSSSSSSINSDIILSRSLNDSQTINQIGSMTINIDRKLNSNMNFVARHLGQIISMVYDIHNAVIMSDSEVKIHSNKVWTTASSNPTTSTTTTTTTTTTTAAPTSTESSSRDQKHSRLKMLEQQIKPIADFSEKIDEVWNVVVGTKSSVDHLVPKSDELLSQTHRQERAIGEVHNDLRINANKIIENLDQFEKRLRKQEDNVAALVQRPAPPEFLLDPTIDRLVEYSSSVSAPLTQAASSNSLVSATTVTPSVSTAESQTVYEKNNSNNIQNGGQFYSYNLAVPSRMEKRKGNIIFPSVKNKPAVAMNSNFTIESNNNYKDVKGYSCADLLNLGLRSSGIYYLQIRGTAYWFLKVYCEQEVADGGWTVIQRRDDFTTGPNDVHENFNRDWNDYKNGFGDPHKEFWLGNENIYMLTNNDDYMLRVELEDFEGNKRFAQYSSFKLHSEAENYKLDIDGYEGTAGDSLNDPWYGSHNNPFSTFNRDNDRSSLNCASMLKGGWWWKSCGRGLNGLYLNDPQDLTARQGIVWFRWRGWDYSLKRSLIMIKPKSAI